MINACQHDANVLNYRKIAPIHHLINTNIKIITLRKKFF